MSRRVLFNLVGWPRLKNFRGVLEKLSLKTEGHGITIVRMTKDFEPLKIRLLVIADRLDEDEQVYFRPLIQKFSGSISEFQRIMRDLGKFGGKIGDGSKFGIYREVQNLYDQCNRET